MRFRYVILIFALIYEAPLITYYLNKNSQLDNYIRNNIGAIVIFENQAWTPSLFYMLASLVDKDFNGITYTKCTLLKPWGDVRNSILISKVDKWKFDNIEQSVLSKKLTPYAWGDVYENIRGNHRWLLSTEYGLSFTLSLNTDPNVILAIK